MQASVEGHLNREEEDQEPEEEFSFHCGDLSTSSAISAEEAFIDGQIKPVFPLFNRPDLPVKNIFVETSDDNNNNDNNEPGDDEIVGPYCEWSSRKAVEASPEHVCKKSNSTGFSRIWRIKDQIVGRSNSDGRDAFVYLNNHVEKKRDQVKTTSSSVSAHEAYLRSKAKGDQHERRRSYLPYRPELVGFFTNVNGGGLTKNVHPF